MENYNIVLTENEAKTFIKQGVDIGANLVAPTLGVRGRKIPLQKEHSKPDFSDDGYAILKEIKLKDMRQQLGVETLFDASNGTNDVAGDGTTTTALLLQSLVDQIIKGNGQTDKQLYKKGAGNTLKMKKELDAGVKKVIDFIDKHKIEVKTKEQLTHIGKVSSNDDQIGTILSDLFFKLGKEASVIVGDSHNLETTCETIEGMKFDKGFISQAFITDGDAQKAVLENPKILVTDYKIQNPEDLDEFFKLFDKKVHDLVVIADDVSGYPLGGLIKNKVMAGLRLLAVKAPGFGQMSEHLKDIAILTGATLISKDLNMEFKDITPEMLGEADQIISTTDSTTIVGGKGDKKLIKARVKSLKTKKNEEPSHYEKSKLDERISKLSGGVGIIKIGAATDIEREQKKAKIDDAIHAVRGAMEDGIVAGGGILLLRASDILSDDVEGESILKKAIQRPFTQILKNADLDYEKIGAKIAINKNLNYGYDVEKEEFGDMIEMGIIDPAKVVKTALQRATAQSKEVLDTAGAIILVPEEKDKKEQLNF